MLKLRKSNGSFDEGINQNLLNQGVKIPDEYMSFLVETNGGNVHKNNKSLYVKAINDVFVLGYLFSIEEISKEYKSHVFEDMPSMLLPFGSNAFGELICFKIKGENYGSIYMFNPSDGVGDAIEGELSSYENIFFVCNSLDEMCSSLKEFEY